MTTRDPARGGLTELEGDPWDGGIATSLENGLYLLIYPDGDFIQPIRDAKADIERAEHTLWRRIGPLVFHDVEVKRGSKFYHTEREAHLRAEAVDLTADGYPIVRFEVVNSYPTEYVEFSGEQLADGIDTGTFKTPEDIHEDVEAELGVEF